MKKFKIGDKVEVLDENLRGVIIHIFDDLITIENDDGFPMEFQQHELLLLDSNSLNQHDLFQDHELAHKETDQPKKKKPPKLKRKEQPVFEVDLHIEKLLPHSKGMSNHEILTYQMETARKQLEFAIKKRIQRLVFIHGVGDGVLKAELDFLLGRYNNISFQDANYQKYGIGATEVYIKQNASRI